jgi:RND family efflux transporter MFP subunit
MTGTRTAKPWAVAAAGIVLALCLAGCSDEETQQGGAPPPPAVEVARPIVKQIVEDDEFIGRFEAVDRVELRSRVDGYLYDVHFTDGDVVQKDQLLFTIDQRPFQARLAQAQADVNSTQAVVEFTKDDLARAVALAERGNISQQTVDQRRQEYRVAEANLAAAQSALEVAKLDLEYTEIRAPIAGRIDEQWVSVGNLVTANSTILTTIVSQDPIYFYFDIDERSYLAYARDARMRSESLQQGAGSLPVTVRLSDVREAPHEGVLDFSQNQLDEGTGTMRVRAVFPNTDGILQPGLFGRINVPGSLPYMGVLIPDEAISADQERRIVYVVDAEGVATARVIRPGPRIDGYRVVREGLDGSETIVINGLMRVRPGVTVTPQLVELPPTRG